MSTTRFAKISAAGFLSVGLLLIAASSESLAEVSVKDVLKYTKDLKTTKDPKVKATAITELGKAGQIQKSLVADAASDIVKALDDKDNGVRAAACKAVGMIDPDPAQPIIDKLVEFMKNEKEDMSVRVAAIEGLGALGEKGKPASKDLKEIIAKEDKDKKSKLAKSAKDAMKQINPKK